MLGTLVDLIETLKSSKSSRSISSTYSTAASTSASTGFSFSSSCRCLGSEPELTPIRIGTPAARAFSTTSPVFSWPPMLPGLMRMQWAPASIALSASVWLKWMSAITGIGDSLTMRGERAHVLVARDGAADEVAARVGDRADLAHGGVEVRGLRLGHRLDGDGSPAADLHAADVDLALRGHERSTQGRSRPCTELGTQGLLLAYKLLDLRAYFSWIGLRFSFIVGVSSSPPGCQSSSSSLNFLICSTRASCSLAASTPLPRDLRVRPPRGSVLLDEAGRHVGVEGDQRDVVGPARRRSRSPGRSAGSTALTLASMFAGDMFLPAALMISSFLRSTIFR